MTPSFFQSSKLRPFPHGFFTRRGGVSTGPFGQLNCGQKANDDPANVEQNRMLAAEALQIDIAGVAAGVQRHSTNVSIVDGSFDGVKPEVDGLVTSTPGVAVSVLTADCQPVLLADHRARVVAAVHAGWKGALNGVIANAVSAMTSLGASPDRISAVIGPSISRSKYEVGEEFKVAFLEKDRSFGTFFDRDDGRLRFNLPAFGIEMLRRSGVTNAECTGHCTYSDDANFFSHRRSTHTGEPEHGLQISMIALKNPPPVSAPSISIPANQRPTSRFAPDAGNP